VGPTQKEEVLNEIRAAFPAKPFFGTVTSCDCEECDAISEGLRHRSWDEVPGAFLDLTCSPVLLTPAAFQAFLPAYMLRGLDDLAGESNVLEFTVYCLSPYSPGEDTSEYTHERIRACLALMSAEQILAICRFLLFVAGHARGADWLQDFIHPALVSIWR
jgi:hypothetical protein